MDRQSAAVFRGTGQSEQAEEGREKGGRAGQRAEKEEEVEEKRLLAYSLIQSSPGLPAWHSWALSITTFIPLPLLFSLRHTALRCFEYTTSPLRANRWLPIAVAFYPHFNLYFHCLLFCSGEMIPLINGGTHDCLQSAENRLNKQLLY